MRVRRFRGGTMARAAAGRGRPPSDPRASSALFESSVPCKATRAVVRPRHRAVRRLADMRRDRDRVTAKLAAAFAARRVTSGVARKEPWHGYDFVDTGLDVGAVGGSADRWRSTTRSRIGCHARSARQIQNAFTTR